MKTSMRRGMAVAMGACAVAAAVGGGIALTAAASAPPPEPGDVVAGVTLPEKDAAAWTLPMDAVFPGMSGGLADYAENVLMAACLEGAGLDWPIPAQAVADIDDETASTGTLTIEWASEHGYHSAGEVDIAGQMVHVELNAIAGSTPGFETVFTTCIDDVRAEHEWTAVGMETADGLLFPSYDESEEKAADDPAVVGAATTWRTCLVEAGFDAVADDPAAMPTAASHAEWGLDTIKDVVPYPAPTGDEIALATADATCRESSGWNAARYEAEWSAQAEFMAAHAAEISDRRELWADLRGEMLQAVDGYTVEG